MVWVDITNSPHALFFEPLITTLRKDGVEFLVTARPYQQTVDLLEQKGIPYELVGKHYGKGMVRKACGLLRRSLLLWKRVVKQRKRIAFSMSHGSPYCSIASKLAGIYNYWTLDGDKAADIIRPSVKFADTVVIPDVVPKDHYVQMGADEDKIVQYPGFKEELYLWQFRRNRHYLDDIGVDTSRPVIVVRPEALDASYVHHTNFLMSRIDALTNDYSVIVLPRTPEQHTLYSHMFGDSVFIPSHVVDGPNVIANASLVISGGGTMTREAVILGTRAISTFREDLLTVDQWLIDHEFLLHNPDPTKPFVDDVMNGDFHHHRYHTSNRTFRFFSHLMRTAAN